MILDKKQALEAALIIMPELNNKIIYKITDENSGNKSALPSDCWYIIYSSQDKSCANQLSSSRIMAISKITGELKHR